MHENKHSITPANTAESESGRKNNTEHSVASVRYPARYPPIFHAETIALIRDDGNFEAWRV
jgi:hypothetical protein